MLAILSKKNLFRRVISLTSLLLGVCIGCEQSDSNPMMTLGGSSSEGDSSAGGVIMGGAYRGPWHVFCNGLRKQQARQPEGDS